MIDSDEDDGGAAWHHQQLLERRRREEELMAEVGEKAAQAAREWAEYEKWTADWRERIRSDAA